MNEANSNMNEQDIRQALANMNRIEQMELISLLSYKVILQSKKEEWTSAPNEFIGVAVPPSVKAFLNIFASKDSQKATDLLIRDLILRGIQSIAEEIGSSHILNSMIEDAMEQDHQQEQ